MTQIVPFDQAGSLDYMRDTALMASLLEQVQGDVSLSLGFPKLSIKGKAWTLVKGDDREVLRNPLDPESPASYVEGVFIRINDKSRAWYSKAFVEGGEDQKPDCYSLDSLAPSPFAQNRQSDKCQTCPHAVFGTRKNADGTMGKGASCGGHARVAFATADDIEHPMLLQVPSKSLKPLREVIDVIGKRGVAYPIVVVRVGFDPAEASPVLTFRPTGVLARPEMLKSVAMREEAIVKQICGLEERKPAALAAPAAPAQDGGADLDAALRARAAEEAAAAQAAARAMAAQAAPAPVQAPAPAPAQTPAPAPAPVAPPVTAAPPQPTVQPTVQPPVTVVGGGAGGGLLDELNSILGQIDRPTQA